MEYLIDLKEYSKECFGQHFDFVGN